jgi:flavin reductase (DIM6/NTAB) family NADH-FMN oxidoreductase RutF
MRAPVAPGHASRLINHGPTVLVTSRDGARRNLMAAAWSMPVEFTPPRIAVVVDKRTWSAELIAASGLVGLCVPCAAQADLCFTVGSESGRDLASAGTDKFTRHGIAFFDGPAHGLPMVEGCVAWLEGRVIVAPDERGLDRNRHAAQAYDTIFVEIDAAQADPRVFRDGRWHFDDDNPDLHTLHHLGGGVFAVPSRLVRGRVLGPAASGA